MTASASPDRPTGIRRLAGQGYPRSFTIGAAFSIAWSPCIGPILGAVLTLAATTGNAGQGAILLFSYALGLGLWFLAFGAFFGYLQPRMRRLNPHLPRLMIGAGAVFIIVGALMFLGEFTRLNNYFLRFGFFFDQTAEVEAGLTASVDTLIGPAIAFFAGIVSLLSPCVLPLVPAYLVNIAGETVLGGSDTRLARLRVMGHSLAFIVGFTIVFTLVGASAGLVGTLVSDQIELLTRIGGVILIFFGMQMAGLIRIPWLERTYQLPG